MSLIFFSGVLMAAVPTPSEYVTRELNVEPQGVFVLAQAEELNEEQQLERDMEESRQKFKTHHHAHSEDAAKDSEEVPDQTPLAPPTEPEETPKKKKRVKVPGRLLDGHGKAYYLTWGIVDWSLAGGSWAASLTSGLIALAANNCANGTARKADCGGATSDEFKQASVGFAITGLALGAVGGFFGWRAGVNIRTFKELRRPDSTLGEIQPPQ